MLTLIVVITLVGSNLFLGFFVASRLGFGPKNFTELFTGIYGRPFQVSDELGSRIRGTLTAGQRKLFYDSVGENRPVPANNELGSDETKLECMLSTLRAVDAAERASVLLDEQRFCGLDLGQKDTEEKEEDEASDQEEAAEIEAADQESDSAEEEGDSESEDAPASNFIAKSDAIELEQWINQWDRHLNELEQPEDLTWWLEFLEDWDEFLDCWNEYRKSAEQLAEAEVQSEEILQKANEIFQAKKDGELARLQAQSVRESEAAREEGRDARRRRRKMMEKNPDRLLPPEYQTPPTLPSSVVDALRNVRQQTIAKLEKLSAAVNTLRHNLDSRWLGKLEETWIEEAEEDLRYDIKAGLSRFMFYKMPEEKEEGKSLWAFLVYFSNAQRIEFQIGSLASYSVSLGISQTLNAYETSQQMDTPFYRLDKKLFLQLESFADDEDGKNRIEQRIEGIRHTVGNCTMFFGDMEIDPTVRVVAVKMEAEEKYETDQIIKQLQQAIDRFTHDTRYIDLTLHPNSGWVANKKKISPVAQLDESGERNRVALFSLFHNN